MSHPVDEWFISDCYACNSLVFEKIDEDGTPTYKPIFRRSPMEKSKHTGDYMVPVLYCDIDGTIRHGKDELGRFVNGPEDVRVFDGVPDLLWGYKDLGWLICGITNQGGVALGHVDMSTVRAALDKTRLQTLNAFDFINICPHHPDAEDPEMAVCWCRKPKAGMVVEAAIHMAAKKHVIVPPHLALFVGDRPEDEQCAQAAGIRFLDAETWRTGVHLETLKNSMADG